MMTKLFLTFFIVICYAIYEVLKQHARLFVIIHISIINLVVQYSSSS